MTQKIINIGTVANDRQGDSLRAAFKKINDNFSEIYAGGIGGGGTIDLSAVAQDIIPAADLTYNLGSPTRQWRSLYVGTNTIYIDNVPLSLDTNGNLTIDGNVVGSGSVAVSDTVPADPSTGSLWYDTVGGRTYIYFDNTWVDANPVPNPSLGNWEFTADSATVSGNTAQIGKNSSETITQELPGGVVSQTTTNTSQVAIDASSIVITRSITQVVDDGVTTTTDEVGSVLSVGNGTYLKTYDEPDGPNNTVYSKVGTSGSFAYLESRQDDVAGYTLGGVVAAPGSVSITTHSTVDNTWTFGQDRVITFPNQTTQLGPIQAATGLEVFSTGTEGYSQLNWGNTNFAWTDNTGSTISSEGKDWLFGTNGNLTLPGKLVAQASDNGSISFSNDGTTEHGYIKVDGGYNMVVAAENNFYIKRAGGDRISVSSTNTELTASNGVILTAGFKVLSLAYDGSITLPDGFSFKNSTGSVIMRNLSYFNNDLEIAASSLTGSTLASGITGSSLTSVGTLTSLTSSGIVHITNTEDSTNADTGSLQVDGGAHITKNLIAEGTIYAGVNAYSEALTNPLIVASAPSGVSGGYSQVAILNNTAEASGDFQVMIDGYDVNVSDTGWADLGMAGSNFSDPRYTITQPGDGYVFASGLEGSTAKGNLVLATDNSGQTNDIVFATGGFTTDKEVMRLSNANGSLTINSGKINSPGPLLLNTAYSNLEIQNNGQVSFKASAMWDFESGWPASINYVTGADPYFIFSSPNDLKLRTNVSSGGTQRFWTFDADGNITLPAGGDIKDSTGTSVLGAGTYTLPTASTTTLGGVKVDGSTIVIDGNGVISSTVVGAVTLKGTWNASTNTPTLSSSLPAGVSLGWQYLVSVTGTRDIGDGTQTYTAGDIVMYDGTKWVDIPGAAGSVASFNNRTGAVTLSSNDVTTALGFTPYNSTNPNSYITSSALTGYATESFVTSQGYITGSGNAATATALQTPRNINGVAFDGTGNITVTAAAGTLTGNTLNAGITGSSLTSVGTLTNLTVTNPISGSVTGSAGSVAGTAITGTTLASGITSSSLTSVGTLANLTVTNTITGSVSGNAGTVTNGVYTTGSYADPSWITSLAYSKLTGTPTIPDAYTLPTATTSVLGGVKVDGSTITINGSGVISASGGTSLVNGSNTLRLVTAPTSLVGATGDQKGDIAIDGGYIYYCTRNYTGAAYTYTVTTNATTASMNSYLPPANSVIGTLVYVQGPLAIQPQTTWTLTYSGTTYNIGAVGNPNNGTQTQVYLTTSGINIPANSTVTLNAPASANIWTRTAWNGIDRYGISTTTAAASGGGSLSYNPINGLFTFAPAVTTNPTFTGGVAISGNLPATAWGVNGAGLRTLSNIYTDSSSSGTVANNMAHAISAPTLGASNTTTYTNAATLYIANAPTAGTNVTLTNKYALWVNAGDAYYGGNIVTPNLPSFRVYGSGSSTITVGTTLTSTNFTLDYQQGGTNLVVATGIFTAPVAGLYQINIVGRAYSNAGIASQLAVVKNPSSTATVMCMIEWAANTTVNHMGASTVAKLAVGDTLVAKVLLGSAQFDANDSWSVAFLG